MSTVKTAQKLNLQTYKGFHLGYRVQLKDDAGTQGREGVLIDIARPTLNSRFSFYVQFLDKDEIIRVAPREVQLSEYLDFPELNTVRHIKYNSASPDHVWVVTRTSKDYASCLFCMKVRVYHYYANLKPCTGPVKVTFRSADQF